MGVHGGGGGNKPPSYPLPSSGFDSIEKNKENKKRERHWKRSKNSVPYNLMLDLPVGRNLVGLYG